MGEHGERRENVGYDDYSGRFYFESKVEALERVSRQKARHAEIMNRSSDKQLENENKLIQSARDIVEGKMKREIISARQSLKDMVSYRTVLNKIGQRNTTDPFHPDHLGKYGVGASYFELVDKREQAKIEMDPATRRRMLSKELLSQRKPMQVLDRTLDTNQLIHAWQKRSRSLSPSSNKKKKKDMKQQPAALRLPPITATKMTKQMVPETNSNPSVFVTQTGYFE